MGRWLKMEEEEDIMLRDVPMELTEDEKALRVTNPYAESDKFKKGDDDK